MTKAGTESTSQALWKRNLLVTWLAEFVAVLAFTTVTPLLPLYVQELSEGGEQEARVWAGVVVAAPALAMAVFAPLWGVLGDRHGRKLMVVRALLGGAVAIGLMGAVVSPEQLALLRVIQGALAGSVTAANVLVASMVPRRRVGHTLGLLWVAIYAGSSAGPIVGGVVADSLGFRAGCYVAGLLLLVAGVAVAVFVVERARGIPDRPGRAHGASPAGPGSDRSQGAGLRQLLGLPALISVLAVRLLADLGAQVLSPVLPFVVLEIAPQGAPVASITGLVSGVGAAAGAVGALWLGRLGDRKGPRVILITCAAAAGLAHLPQAFVREPLALLALRAVSGLATGGILTSITASLARLAPEGREGLVYGIEGTVSSIASGVGPIAGSLLAAWLGLRSPFLLAGVLYGLAVLMTAVRPPAIPGERTGARSSTARASGGVKPEDG